MNTSMFVLEDGRRSNRPAHGPIIRCQDCGDEVGGGDERSLPLTEAMRLATKHYHLECREVARRRG